MAKVKIAIDTSQNKRYTGIVSGLQTDIDDIHSKISKELSKHGRTGIIHWRKLTVRIRKSARIKIYKLMNDSRLQFHIFEHKKPRNISSKEFYLDTVPSRISASFDHWLRFRVGYAIIEVDNDYTVSKVMNSSREFIKTFMSRLSNRIAGAHVKIRDGDKLRATVKNLRGSTLNIIGDVTTAQESKGVQLADLILGYYFFNKQGIKDKIKFERI
jgi:hypothetical protein